MVSLLLTCATTWWSLRAVWYLLGATSWGQPWTPAWTLPHGRDGLRGLRMVVVWTSRLPSRCRHVHRQCMHNALARFDPYRTRHCRPPRQ
jgi:hypothetical protein